MPEIDLLGLLAGEPQALETEADRAHQRVFGVTLGIVTDVDDPVMLSRIKVRFPWLSDAVESAWARVAVLWAGGGRGSYFPPEVDDEVLVAFRHGDLAHPYVLGGLWRQTARPPQTSPRLERRGLKSKSGHELRFDDTTAAGSVRVRSGTGHELLLDDTSGAATAKLATTGGTLKVELNATSSTVTITATTGNIKLVAPSGKVSVEAAGFDVNATGPVQIQSTATVMVKGSAVTVGS